MPKRLVIAFMIASLIMIVLSGCKKDEPKEKSPVKSSYDETFYITPNVEMSFDKKNDLKNLKELKAALGTGGTYAKVGFMGISRYMNETEGPSKDYEFDSEKLEYILDLSKEVGLPVLICLNGGPWGDVIHDPEKDLIEFLEKDPDHCQWKDDGTVPDDSQGPVPGLMRSLSYNSKNTEVFEYWERNYKDAVETIVEFKKENPDLILGVTTDPEIFMSPFYYTDYNPATLDEFRAEMKKEFEGDIAQFNTKMKVTFKTWDAVEPPRPSKNKGDAATGNPLWEKWTDFRIGLVSAMVQREVDWARESGLPANMVYTHQTVRYDNKDWMRYLLCSTMQTANVENGSTGITTLQDLCFDTMLFKDARAAGSNWGIFEYNPATESDQSYDRYIKALRIVYGYHPHIIAPYMWLAPGTEQFYAIKGTAFQDAIRDFIKEVAKKPWRTES